MSVLFCTSKLHRVWLWRAVCYIPFFIWAWLYGPFLVRYRELAEGWCNNNTYRGIEPRLPPSLSDYMTVDNSLWGDDGHKERRTDWREPSGMRAWLRRNPAYGLAWRVPYAHIPAEGVTYVFTGDRAGQHDIKASDGSYEKCRFYGPLKVRTGWILGDAKPGEPCLFLLSIRRKK